MTDRVPVKANYTGSDVTSLGEFGTGDTIPLANGGTGATTASAARTNLGLVPGTDVASLDGSGKIPSTQIPNIAIVDYLGAVANQTAMLALSGQKGDWCTRTDLGTTWIITGSDPSVLGGWTQLAYPAAPVTSVAGKTGAITLTSSDVGLGNVDNTSDATKNSATATLTNKTLTNPTLTGFTETVYTLGTSGSVALNPASGSIQSCSAAAAVTFTDSISAGQSIVLMISGGASYTITWPTMTWVGPNGNAAPTLSAGNTVVFWKVGSTLYGASVGKYA